jgi:hypothetical protein
VSEKDILPMTTARTIQVSTDVFAAIWAARMPGENTEDDVLRRMLRAPMRSDPPEQVAAQNEGTGFVDLRYGVRVPRGFEIERTFKNRRYRARAENGGWALEGSGQMFPTLTALSEGIGTGIENVWVNWHFIDPQTGERRSMSSLRDKTKIGKRSRR